MFAPVAIKNYYQYFAWLASVILCLQGGNLGCCLVAQFSWNHCGATGVLLMYSTLWKAHSVNSIQFKIK
jgi:hypothetical protein